MVGQSTWLEHRVTSPIRACSHSNRDMSTVRGAGVFSFRNNKNWSLGFEMIIHRENIWKNGKILNH